MSLKKKVYQFRTICEVHREIYDILLANHSRSKNFKVLEEKLEESYCMAKRMDNKLRQYKHNYDDGWWERSTAEAVKKTLKRRNRR